MLDVKVRQHAWVASADRNRNCAAFRLHNEWIARRPWEAIRAAMQEELSDLSWTELFFGTAFLAAGSRGPGTLAARPQGSGHQ